MVSYIKTPVHLTISQTPTTAKGKTYENTETGVHEAGKGHGKASGSTVGVCSDQKSPLIQNKSILFFFSSSYAVCIHTALLGSELYCVNTSTCAPIDEGGVQSLDPGKGPKPWKSCV